MQPNWYLLSKNSFNKGLVIILKENPRTILKENPRTIMNGAYSTLLDTNIPGVRHMLQCTLNTIASQ